MQIVRADTVRREVDIKVIAPGPELGTLATHPHWAAMYDAVAQLIREHQTTLVFTLSRRWAERIALACKNGWARMLSRLIMGASRGPNGSTPSSVSSAGS